MENVMLYKRIITLMGLYFENTLCRAGDTVVKLALGVAAWIVNDEINRLLPCYYWLIDRSEPILITALSLFVIVLYLVMGRLESPEEVRISDAMSDRITN